MLKLKTNPGGLIDPKHVIGRDLFIERLWHTLEHQSVILLAERRIGKSTILRKIETEHDKTWLPILSDVEHVDSVGRFVKSLADKLEQHISAIDKGKQYITKLHQLFGGSAVAGITIPKAQENNFHDLLVELFNALSEYQFKQKKQVLLIWDEFPWMLQKIIKNEGPKAAADLLDTLRHCRQSSNTLRFVLTGSIGLHQILAHIRETGFSNEPVNDMSTLSLDALNLEDATKLANALLLGESLQGKLTTEEISQMCQLVDCVPYYIHHVIRSMKFSDNKTPKQIVSEAIAGHDNSWQLEHYYDRLADYYPDNWQDYALILDEFAFADESLSRAELQARLTANEEIEDQQNVNNKNKLKQMLKDLTHDHYLSQNIESAAYQFRYTLIKKWWRFYRN